MNGLGQTKGLSSFSSSLCCPIPKTGYAGKDYKGYCKHMVAPVQLPPERGLSFSFQYKGDLQFTYLLQLAEVCRGNNAEDHPQLPLPVRTCLI